MWVAELGCAHGHTFEGWFGSHEDYEQQRARQLVQCPQCGSAQIERRLSAPRLNLGAQPAADLPAPLGATPAGASDEAPAALREWLAAVRAGSEDMGRHFAAEARRIHRQQAPERAIRGQCSAAEVAALNDEGIEVWPLPRLGDGASDTPH